jgi:hypothetical protein
MGDVRISAPDELAALLLQWRLEKLGRCQLIRHSEQTWEVHLQTSGMSRLATALALTREWMNTERIVHHRSAHTTPPPLRPRPDKADRCQMQCAPLPARGMPHPISPYAQRLASPLAEILITVAIVWSSYPQTAMNVCRD